MSTRLLGIVQLLLLAAAGLIVAQGWTTLRKPEGPPPAAMAGVRERRRPPPVGRPDPRAAQTIVARDLFRTEAGRQPTPAPVVDVDRLERTGLDLKLWGTIAGGTDAAWAVIESPRFKTQQLYRAGDSIEGATLKMILRQKVVLTVDGKDEALLMEAPGTAAAPSNMRAGRSTPARPQPRPRSGAPTPMVSAAPPEPPEVETAETPGLVIQLTAEMLDPVADLLEAEADALFAPAATDDGGVRVSAGERAPVLSQLGLHAGDVITAVDGEAVAQAGDVVGLFRDLAGGEEATLVVRRGRRLQTLRYRLP